MSRLFKKCDKGFIRLFQGCFIGVLWVYYGFFINILGYFGGCFSGVVKGFLGCSGSDTIYMITFDSSRILTNFDAVKTNSVYITSN